MAVQAILLAALDDDHEARLMEDGTSSSVTSSKNENQIKQVKNKRKWRKRLAALRSDDERHVYRSVVERGVYGNTTERGH